MHILNLMLIGFLASSFLTVKSFVMITALTALIKID
jgi:hypothetical protein